MNEPTTPAPDATEHYRFTPLLSIAHDRVGQDVDVHIAGGLTVTGRLTAVNDDETITVQDKARRYDIALGSVAVIEGAKW